MRARAEAFGAWVRLDDATLIAVTHDGTRKLGLRALEMQAGRGPLEVHMSVGDRCPANCSGCYTGATPDGDLVGFETLAQQLDAIAKDGAFTVAFGGGEPLAHPRLTELAEHARAIGLTPVVTTSGLGMTRDKAIAMRAFAQVNVSYDGVSVGRGLRTGVVQTAAERAMALLGDAGVRVGVNTVLTKNSFEAVTETAAHVEALGAQELQLLRYKPAGRAGDLTYFSVRLSQTQVLQFPALLKTLRARSQMSIRVDCALVPFLSSLSLDVDTLRRFGVLGCEAGRYLGAIDSAGVTRGCSFLPPGATAGKSPCPGCDLREVCRGGCRVVAAHAGQPDGPDPECPRVLARSVS